MMRLVIIGLLTLGITAANDTVFGEIHPEKLTCEHLVNPLGIDAAKPRLNWSFRAPGDERCQVQTAYQVLVASSEAALQANQGDLWDSGKVQSDQSASVEYAGQPLKSHERCWWKVRVWDKGGVASEWSLPALWSMGILTPSDWHGKWLGYTKPLPRNELPAQAPTLRGASWIWFPEGDPKKSAPKGPRFFRQNVELPRDAVIRRAEILITADDEFVLYINGMKAGQSDDRPDAWREAKRIDVSKHFVVGVNFIAIQVVNLKEGPAGLLAQLSIELGDGKRITKSTDGSWLASNQKSPYWEKNVIDSTAWTKAKDLGKLGIEPWKDIFGQGHAPWTQEAPSPRFRKTFEVAKPIKSATATICGLGYYELRLNGAKVGDRVLDPVFTRYDRRVLYATYDVSAQVKEGKNALAVMLGNGFYNPHSKDVWYFEKSPWRDRPRLLMQLRLTYGDGTTETIATDGTWKAATGPLVYDGIRNGEVYDARRETPGWDTADFDDSGWAAPEVGPGPKGALRAEMMPPNKVARTINPVSVTEPRPGVFVFDLGQNIAGWAQLNVSGPAGTAVTLRYGERLTPEGVLERSTIDAYVEQGPFQTDVFILKGQGTEVYEPRFTYHGFRWVEIAGFPGKPTVANLQGRVVHTAFAPAGSFQCSSELLNTIQRLTLRSYRGNFVGYPTDCPQREKNGWTGDAQLACEQAMHNFFNVAAYETWINSLKDEQRPSGELPGIVPTSGWGYEWGNGPAWDSAYVLIPWYLYQYRGDIRVLAEHYDRMKLYVDYLTKRSKDHIVDIGLGDWVPAKTETPVAVTSTGYYFVDAVIVSKVARLLGKTADAERYAALAEEIRKAFHRTFVKPDGTVANGSQTAQSCALYQGLITDPAEKQRVLAKLVADVEQKDGHLDTGILGAKYLFHSLTDNGRVDVAWRIANQTTPPSYGDWVRRGATTLWEDWGDGASRNHIMFGDISAWFYKALAGLNLDPAQPGYKHIVIRPRPAGDLKWVRAEHDSNFGPIRVAWQKEAGKFTLNLTVPVNTTATVYVPAAGADSVTEGGKPAQEAPNVKFLRQENGSAVFQVGSGNYSFAATSQDR